MDMEVLYVDDELAAIQKFKAVVAKIPDVTGSATFSSGFQALSYVEGRSVDVAFLDIEMPEINGIELAKKIHEKDLNVKVVFLTAYANYALDAFGVDAIGYLMKPYSLDQVKEQLEKAKRIRPIARKRVFIKTMPHFDVFIDGELLHFKGAKIKELLALLVDRNGGSVTPGQAIACLWEDRPSDEATNSLYRMTYKRLREFLMEAGVDFLLTADNAKRAINAQMYESDYGRFLSGDKEALRTFDGDYMTEYEWAEETALRLSERAERLGEH